MGFPGYFLIVQDFIRAAREELDVSVGPGPWLGRRFGRGLLSEASRRSTRIAIRPAVRAFPESRPYLAPRYRRGLRRRRPRPTCCNWVTQKYGKEKVAHIITYGTMATKTGHQGRRARAEAAALGVATASASWCPTRFPTRSSTCRIAIEYVPELKAAERSRPTR